MAEIDVVTRPKTAASPRWPRLRSAARWVFRRRLCYLGLVGALVAFCLSLTPSLLPRSAPMQGVVSGISVAAGYGVGSAASALVRRLGAPEPSASSKRTAWRILAAASAVLVATFLVLGARWQNQTRSLVEMDPLSEYLGGVVVLVTVVVGSVLLITSRLIRGGARLVIELIGRFVPRRAAVLAGGFLSVIVVVGLIQGFVGNVVVSGLDSAAGQAARGTSAVVTPSTSEARSGGPSSLVGWSTLGKQGRSFTGDGGGPTRAEIAAFTGQPALEPIRVYVGLRSAGSVQQRVQLAMDELDRTGAFERSVIVVITTTGTGWVDENAAAAIEYIHGGDTAQVALQYSYLPSWLMFLVDNTAPSESARALIGAVAERVSSMDEATRPSLLIFGESLGSFGAESAFDGLDDLTTRSDGALLVGPTFANPIRMYAEAERDPSSPVWRPRLEEGRTVRFAVEPADLVDPSIYPGGESSWVDPRVVYLQHPSDPVTNFSASLLWDRPEWLRDTRGPDVSASMRWIPLVTFAQVTADQLIGTDVPAGHGHAYGANVVDGWVNALPPEGWTDERTRSLRTIIQREADERSRKEAG